MNRMTKVLALGMLLGAIEVSADLNVVATLPDFGAIAEEIGGEKVKVKTLAKGTEDAHFVDAKPSFIITLNKADVLLEGGGGLEIGWLPPLVNNARNRKILPEGEGHVVLSSGIPLLDVPTGPVDRSMGDVHELGNPHYWLDPGNGKIIARTLAEHFSRIDPRNEAVYRANLSRFNERLDQKIPEWEKTLEPFRGTKVITYHRSYDYFLKRFGFELAGTIEPKPGIEPSPSYISHLIPELKNAGVKLVMMEPFRARQTAEYLASAIGAKVLVLPEKVGGNPKLKDYFSLFDYNVAQIASALKESK